jgi:hypothetical protein
MCVWRLAGSRDCVRTVEQNDSKRADFIYSETVHHGWKSGREVKHVVADLPRLSSASRKSPRHKAFLDDSFERAVYRPHFFLFRIIVFHNHHPSFA